MMNGTQPGRQASRAACVWSKGGARKSLTKEGARRYVWKPAKAFCKLFQHKKHVARRNYTRATAEKYQSVAEAKQTRPARSP
tara:strand:+ start:1754 stop:1999 length:246 start_codon:yes stop_codon:yes gene_type:complete